MSSNPSPTPSPAATSSEAPAVPQPVAEPSAVGAAPEPAPARPLIVAFDEPLTPAAAKKRARSLMIIRLVALAMILVIGIFWLQTWFGTKLSDEDLSACLANAASTGPKDPEYNKTTRAALHALNDLSRRLSENTPNVEIFFPALAKLADHPEPAVRRTAAWVMGDAPGHPTLYDPLVRLVSDTDPLVQQNAALALAKFREGERSRPILTAMLRPFGVPAPQAGKITQMIEKNTYMHETMQICVLETADGKTVSVLSPLKGRAYDVQAHTGDSVIAGQTLCLLQPNPDQVFAALAALAIVGKADDLTLIRGYTQAGNGDMIRQQAQTAIQAIEARLNAPH